MQPPVNVQARADTIWAPGAAPCMLAAEEPVAGDDAGDVGAVRAADDADADEVGDALLAQRRQVDVLAVVHDERHPLDDGGRRVVDAEVTDLPVLRRTAPSPARR